MHFVSYFSIFHPTTDLFKYFTTVDFDPRAGEKKTALSVNDVTAMGLQLVAPRQYAIRPLRTICSNGRKKKKTVLELCDYCVAFHLKYENVSALNVNRFYNEKNMSSARLKNCPNKILSLKH